jgi:hypothetical protein
MSERKNKREEPSIEMDTEETSFTMEPAKVEIGSGYALSVRYDEHEKPIIDVKTYGKVDLTKLQKEIERAFPNARIRQLANKPSVTIVRTNKKK